MSRGLYQLVGAAGISNVDFVAVCGRAPHGMICLNSVLAYWDLSDEIPAQVHLPVLADAFTAAGYAVACAEPDPGEYGTMIVSKVAATPSCAQPGQPARERPHLHQLAARR